MDVRKPRHIIILYNMIYKCFNGDAGWAIINTDDWKVEMESMNAPIRSHFSYYKSSVLYQMNWVVVVNWKRRQVIFNRIKLKRNDKCYQKQKKYCVMNGFHCWNMMITCITCSKLCIMANKLFGNRKSLKAIVLMPLKKRYNVVIDNLLKDRSG